MHIACMSSWAESEIAAQVPALKRYARLLTDNAHEADELVQQALLKAYEKAPTFKSGAPLKPWLIAILRNCFLANRRTEQARRTREAEYSALTSHGVDQLDPEQGAFVRDVAAAFATLSEEHRSVLHLIAIEGLAYREVAQALDVPIGTVMSRLARARSAIKGALQEKHEPHLRLIGGKDDQ